MLRGGSQSNPYLATNAFFFFQRGFLDERNATVWAMLNRKIAFLFQSWNKNFFTGLKWIAWWNRAQEVRAVLSDQTLTASTSSGLIWTMHQLSSRFKTQGGKVFQKVFFPSATASWQYWQQRGDTKAVLPFTETTQLAGPPLIPPDLSLTAHWLLFQLTWQLHYPLPPLALPRLTNVAIVTSRPFHPCSRLGLEWRGHGISSRPWNSHLCFF